MSNLELWNKLGKTDPSQTKAFTRGGGFKGTAVKPIYTEQKMTEEFGPCGVGWGINEPVYEVVPASEGQVAVYCTVSIWYRYKDKVSAPVFGVGGDLVVVKQKDYLRTDDEAFKKAFTDAIGNAMKHLGMSADVHMGRFDDSKYVQEAREEAAATLSKAQSRGIYTELQKELDACETLDKLSACWMSKPFQAEFKKLPDDWQKMLTDHKDVLKDQLQGGSGEGGYVPPQFDRMEKTENA